MSSWYTTQRFDKNGKIIMLTYRMIIEIIRKDVKI